MEKKDKKLRGGVEREEKEMRGKTRRIGRWVRADRRERERERE